MLNKTSAKCVSLGLLSPKETSVRRVLPTYVLAPGRLWLIVMPCIFLIGVYLGYRCVLHEKVGDIRP